MSSGPLSFRRYFLLTLSISLTLTGASLASDRAISEQIDRLVERNYLRHGIKPNPKVSDELFVRRA